MSPEPIPEPDRLGPLATSPAPRAPISFTDGAAVRAAVLAAVHDAVEPARAALREVGKTPAKAVHDVRKSLRRTRALLDLIGGVLPKRERKDIRAALIEARRTLGPARDLDVAGDVLMKLATEAEVAADAAVIIAAARADAVASPSVADDVARAVTVAEAQGAAIVAALPDGIDATDLADALTDTYRRARRARRRARKSERAAHRWRRRSKELMYQLSMFGDVPEACELRESLSGLDDDLGDIVDRLMVQDFVGLYGHATAPEGVGTLLEHIHDDLIERRDRARKDSRAIFSRRPRKLRKRLTRAILPVVPAEKESEQATA